MKKIFYRVKKGDSLLSIAREFETPVFSIIKNNYLDSEVQEGDMLLVVKPKKCYKVEPFDTYYSISQKFGIKEEELKNINQISYLFYGLNIAIEE